VDALEFTKVEKVSRLVLTEAQSHNLRPIILKEKDMTENTHDFYLVIDRRRTVRNYEDKPVEQDKLHRILEAGMKAPSHNHLREWHFVFLKDPAKRQAVLELGDAFSRTPERKFLDETLSKITNPYQREVFSYSVPLQERMLLTAPELLIVCFRMAKPLGECETLFELNNFASAWLAIENILLAMAAEGVYGVTMVPFRTAGIKKLLGIPDDYEIATFIPMGYPKKEPPVRQVKVELEERIHLDEW
jgi:nitroreductase